MFHGNQSFNFGQAGSLDGLVGNRTAKSKPEIRRMVDRQFDGELVANMNVRKDTLLPILS